MAALQYAEVPGYAAIIFRRTHADLALPGALMDRSRDWLINKAHWTDETKTWSFPSGATLTFGYLETEVHKYRYQGSEFQFCGFDELTQFSETQYKYLFSRLRRLKGSEVPIRMRGASNPGGIGHGWVKQRFLVEGNTTGRTFIPAGLSDNPHVDQDEYRQSLSELDPVTREQLLMGDWDAGNEGQKFRREWFEIVKTAPSKMKKVRYWDLAATEPRKGYDPDWTVGCKVGRTDDGTYYVMDIKRTRSSPAGVEALITQTTQLDGDDTEVWMEQEPGSAGVNTIDHYRRRVLPGYTFRGNRETGSKEMRANPVSSQSEAKNVKLVEGPWIGSFLDEIEAFPGGKHDDQVDAFTGAMGRLMKRDRDAGGIDGTTKASIAQGIR